MEGDVLKVAWGSSGKEFLLDREMQRISSFFFLPLDVVVMQGTPAAI